MGNKKLTLKDLPGIGDTSIDKLEKAGILDIISFASKSPSQITDASGVSSSIARKAIQFAKDKLELGFVTVEKYENKKEDVFYIPTSSTELDNLLGGGIRSGSITEAYAEGKTGKSQLGFTLAVNTLIRGNKVAWIDSEAAFRSDRIKEILKYKRETLEKAWEEGKEGDVPVKEIYESFEKFTDEKWGIKRLGEEECLADMLVAPADNHEFQTLLIGDIEKRINEGDNIKLLVIDSLMEHFRTEFAGRGALSDRQIALGRHTAEIKRLAVKNNIVAYITGQVMANPGQLFGDPIKAIGGNVYAHKIDYRLYLRKGKQGSRVAKLTESRDLPDGEAIFKITEKGVEDN